MSMIFCTLIYFDSVLGPKIVLKSPQLDNFRIQIIPSLMDLHEEGFFTHEMNGVRTANLMFEIPSPTARGRKEIFMISIVTFDTFYNLSSFQEIMEIFIDGFLNIKNIHRYFESNLEEVPEEIATYFLSFDKALPKNKDEFAQTFSKVPIYELSSIGKDFIVNSLNKNLSQSKLSFTNPPIFKRV